MIGRLVVEKRQLEFEKVQKSNNVLYRIVFTTNNGVKKYALFFPVEMLRFESYLGDTGGSTKSIFSFLYLTIQEFELNTCVHQEVTR